RRDTESCYQSSRSKRTKPAFKKHHNKSTSLRKTGALSESKDSAGGHWKSRSKKQRSSIEDDDLSKPWVCEEIDPFTPLIHYFDLSKRTRMPVTSKHMMEVRIRKFTSRSFERQKKWNVGRCQRGATCSIPHSLDSIGYEKCIKDPVEIHYIKQREGESTKDFVCKFKIESRDVKGAPEVMRISRSMHGITNPELIERLHDKIPRSVDEMMRVTTSFLGGELAAGNQEQKKSRSPWKQQEAGHKQNFKKGGFKNQQRLERRHDIFNLLLKSPKKIMALETGKFNAPPPMMTLVKKRSSNKFCEFYEEVGHNSDECMHLKRQIEELLKNRKLLHVIK
nr:reverse transcriptase domain-containing protein [Tanacetum cinerariifolium]